MQSANIHQASADSPQAAGVVKAHNAEAISELFGTRQARRDDPFSLFYSRCVPPFSGVAF